MASLRHLKRDINNTIGSVIDVVYSTSSSSKLSDQAEEIIDQAIVAFDELIVRVNQVPKQNAKSYIKLVIKDLQAQEIALLAKANAL